MNEFDLLIDLHRNLSRHKQSKEAIELVAEYRQEANFYRKYSGYYSYGFYIAQKI